MQLRLSALKKRKRGSGITEVVAGCLILVPLVLLSVDAMELLNANHTNQELAQTAARAAANLSQQDKAQKAASDTVAAFTTSNLIHQVSMDSFQYDPQRKVVSVTTRMTVTIPVPIPGVGDIQLTATSNEPIVALPPAV